MTSITSEKIKTILTELARRQSVATTGPDENFLAEANVDFLESKLEEWYKEETGEDFKAPDFPAYPLEGRQV